MPSPKQITANRRNARRSTGPKSPEGKSASSRNAITHGLLARDPVIIGECYDDFDELQASFYADFQPAGESEQALVRTMATAQWRMERVTRAETALFDSHINDVLEQKKKDEDDHEKSPEDERDEKTRILGEAYVHSLRGNRDPLWRLARYEAMIQRTYSRALADLQRSRKIRAAQPVPASDRTETTSTTEPEIGFVSPSSSKPPKKPAQTVAMDLRPSGINEDPCGGPPVRAPRSVVTS